jgi:HK97 family phage portal protein
MLALFSWFRRRPETTAEPAHEARALTFEDLGWLAPTAAGVAIGPATVMRSPTAAACVRMLAEVICALPCKIFSREPKAAAPEHPAYVLVHDRANGWTSAQDLRAALMVDALTRGDGFALVLRAAGRPRELHRLDPSRVRVEIDETTSEPRYIVSDKAGGQRVVGWRNVIHVQAPGSIPDRPVRILDAVHRAVALDIAMAEWQARVFESGARPSGVLSVPRTTTPDRLEVMKAAWKAAHTGAASGSTAVLPDDVKWEAISLNMVDADALNLRRFGVEEIARGFKVPPVFVGDYSRATWRNLEEASRSLVQFTILPWLEQWQFQYAKTLLDDDSHFVEFVTDDLLRGDTLSLYNALRTATGGAVMTVNEARALRNLPPHPDGDELIRQAGQTAGGVDRNSAESNDANDLPEGSADDA